MERSKFELLSKSELIDEIADLKARLYPFEKEVFLKVQTHKIARLLYPSKTYVGQPKPEFRDPGLNVSMSRVLSFAEEKPKDDLVDITIAYWCGDYEETYTVLVPKSWLDFDNQIEDLYSTIKQWCADREVRLTEEARVKSEAAKKAHIQRLQDELEKALKG